MGNNMDRKQRYFHTDEPDDDGPDTVRILPEDISPEDEHGHEHEWRIEHHTIQRGTLYTPVPMSAPVPEHTPAHTPAYAEPAKPASKAIQTIEDEQAQLPAKRTSRLEIEAADKASMPATPPAVTHIHKGPSACAIIAGTLALLILSCALLGFATFQNGLSKLAGIIPSFGFVTTPTVTIDTSRPTVIDKVRGLSKLETVDYQLEKVVSGKSSGPLPDFLTSDKILLVAHGEVVAGVDLGKLKPGDVTVISDVVTIKMPQAEILYHKLDNDKTYVYNRETGIFNKPDPNLETQIRQAAEQDILKTAQEDGILDKAAQNAQGVVRSLVTGLGYKEVRFTQSP